MNGAVTLSHALRKQTQIYGCSTCTCVSSSFCTSAVFGQAKPAFRCFFGTQAPWWGQPPRPHPARDTASTDPKRPQLRSNSSSACSSTVEPSPSSSLSSSSNFRWSRVGERLMCQYDMNGTVLCPTADTDISKRYCSRQQQCIERRLFT